MRTLKFRVNLYSECSKKHVQDEHGISVTSAYTRIELKSFLRIFLAANRIGHFDFQCGSEAVCGKDSEIARVAT